MICDFYNSRTDFQKSRLFGSAPDKIIDILKTEAVTPNFHSFCVTQQVH